ncbi:unnamed protein product [Notodromas monacha]|uniref:C2H2-type domain-containing protein n=1 Tax=Notodromas monacha TaxID=399045 RepID=A0A7R9BDX0_9CRUS|nr:unnamed protein product [Notodromas monacha]CAG0912659.1 unnamed protein product [Notodromas monacha]
MHKSAMQLHAREAHRNDIKPHQCQQCMKSFSSNHQLVQHIRVHTGEKPYKCSYCDRRFKQLSHVQQHTRLHTGQSVSQSDLCWNKLTRGYVNIFTHAEIKGMMEDTKDKKREEERGWA